MKGRVALIFAVLAVFGAPAAGAQAASVVYVGADGNVWLASPDGSIRHRVTDNATADLKYRSPSQMNDGRIVALRKAGSDAFAYFLRRTDGDVLTTWLMPSSGSGLHFAPYTGGQVSPGGGLIVYDYFHADGPFNGYYNQLRVGFLTGPGQTDPCLVNCEGGFLRPRWLPGLDVAGMIDDSFTAVYIQEGASPREWFRFTPAGTKTLSFDTQAGKTVAVAQNDSGSFFVMMRNDGGYSTPPTVICSSAIHPQAVPRLSPDGNMVAWQGEQGGVFVSPAPTSGPECSLQPRLIGPGGTQPDWGPQNAPDLVAPAASLKAPRQPLRAARNRGVRLNASCSERCTMSVKGYVNGATARRFGLGRKRTLVARGSKAGGPGNFSFRAQLTAKAKRKLADAGGVLVSFSGSARDGSGNSRNVSARARLTG